MAAERADDRRLEDEEPRKGRLLAILALLLAAAIGVLVLTDEDPYELTAEFANASQLVGGNEVVIGGVSVGTVESVELGPDGQALVTFTVEDEFAPLHRGTTATIRSPSLSQIAGRQVQLTLPPSSSAGEEIESGERLSQAETVSAVDLDQLFNTLSPKTIRDFKHVIQGFELSYQGVERRANKGVRYLNPLLSTSRRLFGELTADRAALENLLIDTAKLSGAVAERAPDVSALIGNLNQMMGALGARRAELAESIAKLPDFMREANTTFVNLRATLDDVDPLVSASKPVAERLGPFLATLREAADDAVPTIRDLDAILKRRGADNDLVELSRIQPKLTARALGSGSPECGGDPAEDYAEAADGDFTQGAFGESICALQNSIPQLAFFRAYSPELVGWFDGFSHSGYIDANGGAARVEAIFNTYTVSESTGLPIVGPGILPKPLSDPANLGLLRTGATRKCPGANERPLAPADPKDDSVPFTDAGALTDGEGDCDPSIVQPGP